MSPAFGKWLRPEAVAWLQANRDRLAVETDAWVDEFAARIEDDPLLDLQRSLWCELTEALGVDLATSIAESIEPITRVDREWRPS